MKKFILFTLTLLCTSVSAKSPITQSQALQIFKAGKYTGKFNTKNLTYKNCETLDDGEEHCTVAHIEFYKDINGDGKKEALIIDKAETSYTYGNTGQAFTLLSQDKSGFRVIANDIAIPRLLKTKGKNGYPDIELGGPGFCFAVLRYNGTVYQYHRSEYQGKACKW